MNAFRSSLSHAGDGLIYILRHERNARVHLVMAILVFTCAIIFRLTSLEVITVTFAVIIVFLAEVLNSAIEKTLDIVSPGHHPTVKIIKDMTAGAVLVAAVGAAVIGLIVFVPYGLRAIGW